MNSVSATSARFLSFQQWSPMGVLASGIFVIDLLIPLGVATGVLYVAVVFMSLRYQNSQLSLWTAISCSALTIIALFLSPLGGELWKVLMNRGLSLVVIWTTTVLGRHHLQQTATIQARDKTIQDFMTSMPSACFTFDRQGTILSWNPAAETIYGYSQQEAIGASCYDLIVSPKTLKKKQQVIARIFQGEVVEGKIWNDRNKYGELGWRIGNFFPVLDTQQQVAYGVNITIDITAQKMAESELQNRNAWLEGILYSSPDAIYVKDATGKHVLINQVAANLLGKTPDDIIGLDPTQLVDAETAKELSRDDEMVLTQSRPMTFEETLLAWNPPKTFSSTKFPLKDATGTTIGVVSVSRDITQMKQIETELRASEYRYRSLIETAGSIIIGLTPDGWIVEWNREAERLYGKAREEVLSKNYFELFLQEKDQLAFRSDIKEVLKGTPTRDFQTVVRAADGNMRQVLWNVDRLLNETDQPYGIICIGRDISEWGKAQAQLQKWATIFQHTQWGVVVSQGLSANFEMVNQALADMVGYTIDELYGKSIAEISAFSQSQLSEMIPLIYEHGVHSWETSLLRKDHSQFPALVTVSAIKDSHGLVLYHVANVIDISNLKETEQALRESQQIYQDLVQTIEGIVWESDFPSYQITFVSQFAEKLLGYPIHAWKADPQFFLSIIHPDDRQRIAAYCYNATTQEENHVMEYRVIHANGSILWLRDHVTVVIKQNEPVKLRGVMLDITGLKQSEETIRATQELALGTMNVVGAHICVLDEAGTILFINDRWKNFALANGGSLDTIGIGKNYLSTCIDDKEIAGGIREVLNRNKKEFVFEYASHSNTESQWFICRVNSFSQDGQARAVVAHLDITEQKRAEQQLRENEVFTNSILENLPNMVFVKNADDLRFVRINRAGETLLGRDRQELLGKNDYDFYPKDEADFFYQNDQMALSHCKLLDIPEEFIQTKGRGKRTLHTKKLPICDTDGIPKYLLGISEDITERKYVKDELRKTESTLKSFFDGAPMMMGVVEVTSHDVRHLSDNQATANFFGQPEGGTTGKWCSQLGMPKDVMETWIAHYQLSLKHDQPVSFEYAHPFPQETKWIAATVTPVILEDSLLPRCAFIAQDITERKTMEDQVRNHAEELEQEVERRTARIQELEQRRMQVEKLAALSQIAAGVAHEINNPLASISQSLVLLKRAISQEHPHFRYMAKVEDCIDRIAKITKHLYQLYRPSNPMPTPVDLRTCLQTATEIMEELTFKREMRIKISSPSEPVITQASQGELIQVLCNLIQNAIDASHPGSTIEMGLTTEPETLSIFVADQGRGIPLEATPHIFEPFYTTKQNQTEGGMGLGLSISHSLVESMGGTLDFSTTIGHGSTFIITLPLTLPYDGGSQNGTGNRSIG